MLHSSLITRRQVLRQSSAAATLAAASSLAPFVASGCKPITRPNGPSVKVGILHSQTGAMGVAESALRDAELLAIEEINADGGVMGHRIEPVVKDPRSDFNVRFPQDAKRLLIEDEVAVIFGCWTSSSRKAVLPVLETLNGLLFYPLQYEGYESSYNVVYSGSLPNQQIMPAIDWLLSAAGGSRRRFYLIGSDYVFPWTAHYIIEKYLHHLCLPDAEIVGFRYVPFGHQDFSAVVREIHELQPDAIISTINGESNIFFFRELFTQGITADQMHVVSTSLGEDGLRSIPQRHIEGHLSAWGYFQSIDTPRNRRFVRRFQSEHGEDRVVDDPMEAAYAQVYLWKQAVEQAQSFAVDDVRSAFVQNVVFRAPGGSRKIDAKTLHAYKKFLIGRARDDRQFEIVFESPDWIAPDPYPAFAFPGWQCDWTRSGLTQGPNVVIGRPT